jgi:hypothetical protein
VTDRLVRSLTRRSPQEPLRRNHRAQTSKSAPYGLRRFETLLRSAPGNLNENWTGRMAVECQGSAQHRRLEHHRNLRRGHTAVRLMEFVLAVDIESDVKPCRKLEAFTPQ